LRRSLFISAAAVLGAVLASSAGAVTRAPSYVHDVKVFRVHAGGSTPVSALLTVLVGGKGRGTMVNGPNGKRFAIADVVGGKLSQMRVTGTDGRRTLGVEKMCRNNPEATYYIRASAVINGKPRKAFTRGDCPFVNQVLARRALFLVRTTFVFQG
jgi:hypothetical protein